MSAQNLPVCDDKLPVNGVNQRRAPSQYSSTKSHLHDLMCKQLEIFPERLKCNLRLGMLIPDRKNTFALVGAQGL